MIHAISIWKIDEAEHERIQKGSTKPSKAISVSCITKWNNNYLLVQCHKHTTPSGLSQFGRQREVTHMMSSLPSAMAQVAAPSLAPFLRKHCTTLTWPQPMARSRGRIPFRSTCSSTAPQSSSSCNRFRVPVRTLRGCCGLHR